MGPSAWAPSLLRLETIRACVGQKTEAEIAEALFVPFDVGIVLVVARRGGGNGRGRQRSLVDETEKRELLFGRELLTLELGW